MKKKLLFIILLSAFIKESNAQAIINSWIYNLNGKKGSYWTTSSSMPPAYTYTTGNDSADVLKVCYNADTVWMYSKNISDNLGKWFNPGGVTAQTWVHRFPRNPTVPVSKTTSPKVGEIGMLINGIAIYGLGNASSWTGTTNANTQQGGVGVWNVEVGLSEGFVLDTAFGAHPQQQGIYHTHTTPYRLYKYTSSTVHSPLIGWAFDGYPIYGPYGYSSAMDANSGVTRMKTGYSLRNITTRTTLPDGTTATQTGPAVNTTYPIGTYCEDYEWLASNNGHLDKYNGRTCITPEFPRGTYAYFVTIDATGKAQFPYYIGPQYYGKPDAGNFPVGMSGNGITIPSYISVCTSVALPVNWLTFAGKLNEQNQVCLQWVTASEKNNRIFEAERSVDGFLFVKTGTVQSKGNTSSATIYRFTDNTPFNGRVFYRIRQIDLNGEYTYSETITLNTKETHPSIGVFPNPFNDLIKIDMKDAGISSATIILTDVAGRIRETFNTANNGSPLNIQTQQLPDGVYFLNIITDTGKSEIFRLLK